MNNNKSPDINEHGVRQLLLGIKRAIKMNEM